MILRALKEEEVIQNQYSHVLEVDYRDLIANASGAACTLTLFSDVELGFAVERAAYELVTPFDFSDATLISCTAALKIASTDIIAASQWAADGTPVTRTRSDVVRAAGAATDDVTLVFAGTSGKQLSTATSGSARVYLKASLPKRLNNVAPVTIAAVDTTPPGVSSFIVQVAGSNTTTFRITFSEAVTGVSAGDFSFVGTGDISGAIDSVSVVSTTVYDVVTTHAGEDGAAVARLAATGHGIADLASNAFAPGSPVDSDARTLTPEPADNEDRYWGLSTDTVLDAAGILALSEHDTATDHDLVMDLEPADEYIYYAFPARYGALSSVLTDGNPTNQLGAYTGNNGTFTSPLTISVTPVGGEAENYLLYRSNQLLTSSGVNRTFS